MACSLLGQISPSVVNAPAQLGFNLKNKLSLKIVISPPWEQQEDVNCCIWGKYRVFQCR